MTDPLAKFILYAVAEIRFLNRNDEYCGKKKIGETKIMEKKNAQIYGLSSPILLKISFKKKLSCRFYSHS